MRHKVEVDMPGGIKTERFRDPFTVYWSLGSEVPVGDHLVPSVVVLRADVPPHSERPGLVVTYEVIGGTVRCVGFSFWTERPEQSVRRRDIEWAAEHFDDLRTEALTACTMKPGRDGSWVMPGDRNEVRGAVRNLPRPANRSLKDSTFLARIADVYNANPVGGTEAVGDAFEVSRSMAQRYVKAARDAGLVEDRRRNRSTTTKEA
jgi:hypothetical protein